MRRILNSMKPARSRAMTRVAMALWLMADEPLFRAYAVQAMAKTHDLEQLQPLLELAIKDECVVVRRAAAKVLSDLT